MKGMPSSNSGRPTFSAAVRMGKRLKNWKINPTRLRRIRVSSSSEIPCSGLLSMKISPDDGWSSPPIRFKSVLLPDPLGPMTERNAPVLMLRVTLLRARISFVPVSIGSTYLFQLDHWIPRGNNSSRSAEYCKDVLLCE